MALPKHKEKFYERIGSQITRNHWNAKNNWDAAVKKLDAVQVMQLYHDEVH